LDDAKILRLASSQDSLLTREQFLRYGSKDQLKYWLRRGRLVRVYESVYRLPGAELRYRQRLPACMAGGSTGVASFRAAAHLGHLPGGCEIVEITTVRHTRWNYADVVVHESRHLGPLDVMDADGIPTTTVARTLCDLAGLVELRELPRRDLDLALLEAVRRDLVDMRSVWAAHDRLGGSLRLGSGVILDALRRFVPPLRSTESTAESKLLLLVRQYGFPEPVPQDWITLPDGERVRLDLAWPRWRASMEFDPYKFHGDRDRYEKDAARTRKMQAMGWDRVRVTDDDLDAGIPEAAAALRAVLDRRACERREYYPLHTPGEVRDEGGQRVAEVG
jgi:very-short-patch-repair endonuclease